MLVPTRFRCLVIAAVTVAVTLVLLVATRGQLWDGSFSAADVVMRASVVGEHGLAQLSAAPETPFEAPSASPPPRRAAACPPTLVMAADAVNGGGDGVGQVLVGRLGLPASKPWLSALPVLSAPDQALHVPVTTPSFLVRRPRRCIGPTGRCTCLVEEEACLKGYDVAIVSDEALRPYCANPPIPVNGEAGWRRDDPTLIRVRLSGWIAADTFLFGPYRCSRTMCEVVGTDRKAPLADAELQSIGATEFMDSPKPFATFVHSVLYTESHGKNPILDSPDFAASKDVRISYKPNVTELSVSICKYSEAQMRMPGLPFRQKTGLVAWMARHEVPEREAFVAELMRYIPVHAFGKRLQNKVVEKELPECATPRTGREFYTESECIMYRYKFYLALENDQSAPYYHTEKFYQPLAMGTIPVYFGNRTIFELAPGADAFIYAGDFQTVADLARYMERVANDEALYESYRAWKSRPFAPGFDWAISAGRETVFCQLCDHVAARRRAAQAAALQSGFSARTLQSGPGPLSLVAVAAPGAGDAAADRAATALARLATTATVAVVRPLAASDQLCAPSWTAAFLTAEEPAAAAWAKNTEVCTGIVATLTQLAALAAALTTSDGKKPTAANATWTLLASVAADGDDSCYAAVIARAHAILTGALAPEVDIAVVAREPACPAAAASANGGHTRLVRCQTDRECVNALAGVHGGTASLLVSHRAALSLVQRWPVHHLNAFSIVSAQMLQSLNVYSAVDE